MAARTTTATPRRTAAPSRLATPARAASPARTGLSARAGRTTTPVTTAARSPRPASSSRITSTRTAPARTPSSRTAPSRAVSPRNQQPRKAMPQAGDPIKRQRWVIVIAAAIVIIFAARLVQVQVFQASSLAGEARQARMSSYSVPAHRGDITDRNGVVLATSVDRYKLAADQKAIMEFRGRGREDAAGNPVGDGPLGVAQLLAPVLGTTKNELAARLNGENRYAVLAKDVTPDKQREVRALGLQAYIRTELVSQRVYPAATVAGTLVGFVDADQQGQGGVER
ncbi:MAG: penicillin-binding protein 2, partial [Cellulomonadaceae bacterium]|nr:penicillin-binding protein 2 [Cellulomonadaceae bacterium]